MLRLYNTLTRKTDEFVPLEPRTVKMYVCGPTVYDDPHIGHARSAYIFDVLCRYLRYKQYQVTFVRNVTDVDDKIIQKANEAKQSCEQVAERYLNSYHEALGRLGIGQPTDEPKATGHLDAMLNLVSELIVKGAAYEAAGDVYFAVRKFPGYGKLSNRTLDELRSSERGEHPAHADAGGGAGKQDPLDFALWKAAKP
ncbi:MAG: class I tRNA ligase family protein, partial [Candidatus Omnitrophica bacterium]|nr:class I tRNA ligase family protein [Candidatus Omnitrophota bacterium]